MTSRFRSIFLIFATFVLATSSFAATSATTSKSKKKEGRVAESARAQRHMARLRHKRAVAHRTRKPGAKSAIAGKRSGESSFRNASTATSRPARLRHRRHRYVEQFYTSSYATDAADGDDVRGEDAVVRQAAIDALGNMNGTVVAIDPNSGRILAMVNQKLALSEGAQPCSTIKVSVALAALSEGGISRETEV
jgi:penicillin-binding protein 2